MTRVLCDYVADILNALDEVESFTGGMDYQSFVGDKKTINSVVRSLEVMGEAAKRIPEDFRQAYP